MEQGWGQEGKEWSLDSKPSVTVDDCLPLVEITNLLSKWSGRRVKPTNPHICYLWVTLSSLVTKPKEIHHWRNLALDFHSVTL